MSRRFTVTTYEEFLEALAQDPLEITIEGLIPIKDSRLGNLTWATSPGKPFNIDDPTSYNPLINKRLTLKIPNGSGFVFGKNSTDPN